MSAEAKKGFIISELKKNGCRITSQRKLLIDVILQDECSCCKEIYYKAAKRDPSIGMATVYRMVKTLEEAGLIQRKNMYRIDYDMGERMAFAWKGKRKGALMRKFIINAPFLPLLRNFINKTLEN